MSERRHSPSEPEHVAAQCTPETSNDGSSYVRAALQDEEDRKDKPDHSTAQHGTARHSTAQHGTAWIWLEGGLTCLSLGVKSGSPRKPALARSSVLSIATTTANVLPVLVSLHRTPS